MNWNKWIRQLHRWVAVLFTLVGALIFGALGLGQEPPEPVYMLPLLPLALLLVTGLYLFVLPHAWRWRGRRHDAKE